MEKIFLSVLNMSLTASFVIAAIMIARLPLKKAPKIISYALWAVAGFRLVFPFSFESVFSLLPFNAAPIPQNIAAQPVPRIESGIAVLDNAVSAALPAAVSAASVNPLQVWLAACSYVWLLGLAVMLIYSVVSIILLKRRLAGAALAGGNLYEADNLKTPFVIGLFKPKIYIPAGLSGEEFRYIVLHEQTHIQRYDHAVKMFAYLVLCLHWFNPFAWAAFLLMGADQEMSCDERVMRVLGGDIKNDYSMSLVRVAAGSKILNGSPLAFGEGGMKERVRNVLNFKKPARTVIIAAVAFVAVISVGFAANRANVDSDSIYNFDDFLVNGSYQLNHALPDDVISKLTPSDRFNDDYQYNFEEVRYSTDADGLMTRFYLEVFETGIYDMWVRYDHPRYENVDGASVGGDGIAYVGENLTVIEQIEELLGKGKTGWHDRGQKLRYERYAALPDNGGGSVTFVYADSGAGSEHGLVWVIADRGLSMSGPVSLDDDYFKATGGQIPALQAIGANGERHDFRRFSFDWSADGKGVAVDTIAPWDDDWDAGGTIAVSGETMLGIDCAAPFEDISYAICTEDGAIYDDGTRTMISSLSPRLAQSSDGAYIIFTPFDKGVYYYQISAKFAENNLNATYAVKIVVSFVTVPEAQAMAAERYPDAKEIRYAGEAFINYTNLPKDVDVFTFDVTLSDGSMERCAVSKDGRIFFTCYADTDGEMIWGASTGVSERPPENSRQMTLDDVRGLAQKVGADLTLGDLADFSREDIGSGFYILEFPIEGGEYRLIVHMGGSLEGRPGAAWLSKIGAEIGTDESIDIRYYDVDKYIADGSRMSVRPLPSVEPMETGSPADFSVTPESNSYALAMSSAGIGLRVSGGASGTVQYTCESGSLREQAGDVMLPLGSFVERDFGSLVFWRPDEYSKDGDRVNVSLITAAGDSPNTSFRSAAASVGFMVVTDGMYYSLSRVPAVSAVDGNA